MKEYELKEAFTKLKKNSKLVFKSGGAMLHAEESVGKLFPKINFNYYSVKFDEDRDYLNMKWILVPQPVSFIEAIQSSNLVRVEHKLIADIPNRKNEVDTIARMKNGEYVTLDDLMYYLSYKFDEEELRDILLNGKWYVEED